MRKLFLVSFMLIGLVLNNAHTEEIKSIEINGNNRIRIIRSMDNSR